MQKKVNFPIDIVITWVDQNDRNWKQKYNQYSAESIDDKSETRFRDYGTLKYVFRSIDKYAPWVHQVFLVTDHQIPEWLNLNYSNVKVVFHDQIISKEYLPTFNSNVIDLSLVKIPNLSDHFIYFNDDMFLNAPVKKGDFFSPKGLIKDTLALNAIMPSENFDHIFVNNISLINSLYNKNKIMKHLFFKIFNYKNMEFNLLNVLLAPFPRFSRFVDPHVPIAFRKNTINTVLDKHPEIYRETRENKFRSKDDFSIWVFRYIELLSGNFVVRNAHFGKGYQLSQIKNIRKDIKYSKHKIININDTDHISDHTFDLLTKTLVSEFQKKFPFKSNFEK